jgi:hypothetical protein
MQNTGIIISINVHEKPHFLLRQLDNIKQHMMGDYFVILNCNQYMFDELRNISLPANVIINPDIINKHTMSGLLAKGIYSNMKLSLERFSFQYFIVLSSRNFFYNKLSVSRLDEKQPICDNIDVYFSEETSKSKSYIGWWWGEFTQTLLAKHYLAANLPLVGTEHEGLCFHYHVCKNIHTFFEKNIGIAENVFDFNCCTEEFALQTIATNEIDPSNRYYKFMLLGHGVNTHLNPPSDPNLFLYKTFRN